MISTVSRELIMVLSDTVSFEFADRVNSERVELDKILSEQAVKMEVRGET